MLGHRAAPQFEADHESRACQGFPREFGVRQVVRVEAADDQAGQFAPDRRVDDARGVTAGAGRNRDAPDVFDRDAGGVVGDAVATGQQAGHAAGLQRAALAGPPRDPREADAGAFDEFVQRGEQAGDL